MGSGLVASGSLGPPPPDEGFFQDEMTHVRFILVGNGVCFKDRPPLLKTDMLTLIPPPPPLPPPPSQYPVSVSILSRHRFRRAC